MERAAKFLNGQRFIDIAFFEASNMCKFKFDLDGELVTDPGPYTDTDQWTIYPRGGKTISLTTDGFIDREEKEHNVYC